jgi:hypothetical protein
MSVSIKDPVRITSLDVLNTTVFPERSACMDVHIHMENG